MRHARPTAGWGEDPDPGLDDTGVQQAAATAQVLAQNVPPLRVYTSPLRRCRETASPLAQLWNLEAEILAAFGEVPAPGATPAERQRWLKEAMRGKWSEVPGPFDHMSWRRAIVDALFSFDKDTIVYTHYIAINVVVAAARCVDDVVCFRPDHASITTVECSGRALKVLELGRQAETTVLARG